MRFINEAAMKRITTHIHSFSLRYHLRYRPAGYDVFAYINEMADAGFDGVNISANGPGFRDLCGTSPEHFARVKEACRRRGLKMELDMSSTSTADMRPMLAVAHACGADTLRTYTRYKGELADLIAWTKRDLKEVAGDAAALGITIVLENHEDFQGAAIAEILDDVANPFVRALYDYGNSQMVGEEPFDALEAMARYIHCVHIKDHVITIAPDGSQVVQGVPMGEGLLPIIEQTDRLYALGLRRFCFENVWSYVAPVKVPELPRTPCFALQPPSRYLKGDLLPPDEAVAQERAAHVSSLNWFRHALQEAGYETRLKPIS